MGATAEGLPDLLTANPTPGIKIFMGSMHGALLVDQEAALERIFSQGSRLIAVHAEDQERIRQRRQQFAGITNPAVHSQIQDNQAALTSTLSLISNRDQCLVAAVYSAGVAVVAVLAQAAGR